MEEAARDKEKLLEEEGDVVNTEEKTTKFAVSRLIFS